MVDVTLQTLHEPASRLKLMVAVVSVFILADAASMVNKQAL
jgi:hypothetical protein